MQGYIDIHLLYTFAPFAYLFDKVNVHLQRVNGMLIKEKVKSHLLCPYWMPCGYHVHSRMDGGADERGPLVNGSAMSALSAKIGQCVKKIIPHVNFFHTLMSTSLFGTCLSICSSISFTCLQNFLLFVLLYNIDCA